jgi:ATP-dependent Clp protease adapter protein ClpS
MTFFGKMKEKLLEWLDLNPDLIASWAGGSVNDETVPLGQAYCIEILNDDHTPMDFVVYLLMTCCQIDKESAMHLMLEVHTNGFARIGHSSQENMESLAAHLNTEARGREYPLFVRAVLK